MDRVIRITSVTCVFTVLLTAVPSLFAAQRLGTVPAQISTWPVAQSGLAGTVAMCGIILGLVAMAVILSDITRKHAEQGRYLQARVSGALLEVPHLAMVPVAATVHVPLWRPAAAIITLTGRVPTPQLREAAMRTVFDKTWVEWPSAQIKNRIVVEPPHTARTVA